MQRPPFSQSPKRVGSGPWRPPISRGACAGRGLDGCAGDAAGVRSAAPLVEFVVEGEADDDGGTLRGMRQVCQKAF